jgi:multiple sugar transport system ATP-binding protein
MRGGRTAQEGTPLEVYSAPADTFVAAFVGSPKMNLIDGELSNGTFSTATGLRLAVEGTGTAGAITLGVRPDDLMPAAVDDERAGARVKLVELLGPRAIVTLDAGGTELTSVVEASRLSEIREGAPVALSVRQDAAHLFDAKTGQRVVGTAA